MKFKHGITVDDYKEMFGLPKWRREDFEAIPDRMREQKRTIAEVCMDPDLPCWDS